MAQCSAKLDDFAGAMAWYSEAVRLMPEERVLYDEILEVCARLKMPVLIHTAEPQPFFDPIDKHNERWRELHEFPARARPADRYPTWQTLMDEQRRMFARHPHTMFINAHLGWLGNDLAELGRRTNPAATERRSALLSAMEAIRRYERRLAEPLIEGLMAIPRLTLYGLTDRHHRHVRKRTRTRPGP